MTDDPSHKRERTDVSNNKDPTTTARSTASQQLSVDGMENADWVDSTDVQLDRFNSDLNVEVANNGYTAKPQSFYGFGYMWAGVRANYGVTSGKVAFQIKVSEWR